jgi:hypothetical protein
VCLEQRIGGVARSLRKRTDGLARTLLDQEGEPQEMQRPGMLRMPAQHVARNALGFIWATFVDSGPTKTKGLLSRSYGRSVCVLVVVHARPTSFRRHSVAPYPNIG